MAPEAGFHFGVGFFVCVWLAVTSLAAAAATVYDKIAAKKNPRHRVPENTLIYLAALGGSVAEFAVMLLIRHKTRHKKFMIGLPVIIVIQAAAAAAVILLTR